MSEFEFKFRSDEAEDLPEFGALPEGKHRVKITGVSLNDTNSGGKRLVLNLTALEGKLEGLTTRVGLNIVNANPKAEAISRSQLKKLSQAIGRPDWDDIRVLKDEEVIVNLKLKPARQDPYENKEYPPSNEIRGFYPIEKEEIAEASDTIPFPQKSEAPQAPTLPKTEEVIAKSEELPWNK